MIPSNFLFVKQPGLSKVLTENPDIRMPRQAILIFLSFQIVF